MKAKRKRGIPETGNMMPLWILLLPGSLAAIILITGCLGSGSARELVYLPGTYEGTGRGYRGPIHVQVQVSLAGIEGIIITGHAEGPYPGGGAIEELLEYVLETGSTDLDAVSGATFSSRGFLEAVDDALRQALQ